MMDSLRRVVIFIIMVGIGTLLILFDFPLIFILPLVTVIGFLLLILLGQVSVAELKSSISNLKKISFIRRRNEKKTPIRLAEPARPDVKPEEPAPFKEKKRGLSLHLSSLISSFRELCAILTTRKKTDRKKVEEIDILLDETVSKKVDVPRGPAAGIAKGSILPTTMPTGSATGGDTQIPPPARPEDPFLSLSSDEFETGLLESLEGDNEAEAPSAGGDTPAAAAPPATTVSGLAIGEPDFPVPPQDVPSELVEIPKADEPDLEEFGALEGTDTIDENLGELDSIDFNTVEFDEDMEEEKTDAAAPASSSRPDSETVVPAPAAPAPPQPSPATAPAPAERPVDPADMAVFVGASGPDDDMVSLLAADIRTVKKTQDISLPHDLKDLKVPAKEIESELLELYTALNVTTDRKRKKKPSESR